MTSISPLETSRRHDISIHPRGRIDISARIITALGCSPGDVIDFCTLHSFGSDIFICVRHRTPSGRHIGQCFPTSRSGNGTWRIWSMHLAKTLRSHLQNIPNAVIRIPCGDPITINNRIFIPLITRLQSWQPK